ncbi:hypothetical protein D3C81_1652790 [compost metagenome]
MANWRPVYSCFPGEQHGYMLQLFPMAFEVDAEAIANRPSAADPLGAMPMFKLEWSVVTIANEGGFRMRAYLFEQPSPWLDQEALRTWLLIEYPQLFRWRA